MTYEVSTPTTSVCIRGHKSGDIQLMLKEMGVGIGPVRNIGETHAFLAFGTFWLGDHSKPSPPFDSDLRGRVLSCGCQVHCEK